MRSVNYILIIVCLAGMRVFAQPDSASHILKLSSYLETYYSFDSDLPSDHLRPGFLSSYNRAGEFALNLGYLSAGYEKARIKSMFTLMTGTYAQANLSHELPLFRSLYEGWIGAQLIKDKELWLDAGVFPSHIGFESAVGADCWTLSRSILAENSPYYESGIRLHYSSPNRKWKIMGLVLNGWQSMRMNADHTLPSLGHQLVFKPSDKVILNSSSFLGHVSVPANPAPHTQNQLRLFHNLYGIFQLHPKFALTAGFDVGAQRINKDSAGTWYAPILLFRYTPNPKWKFAARAEYYSDLSEQIINNPMNSGFEAYSYSLNSDYELTPGLLLRLEYRAFLYSLPFSTINQSRIFRNTSLTGSMSVKF